METDSLRTLRFSRDFIEFWGTDENAEKRIAESAILEAFREKKITSARAASIVEMSEDDFLELHKRRKIFVIPGGVLDEDDWIDMEEIIEYLFELKKTVQEEIQEGDFLMLDDLKEKFGD